MLGIFKGQHHLYQRRAIHKFKQKYPHPNPKVRIVDSIVMASSVIAPLTALPQVYNIWVLQNTVGVSLLTWVLFLVLAFPFLAYGIVHKLKQIIVLNVLWIVMELVVIVGILANG